MGHKWLKLKFSFLVLIVIGILFLNFASATGCWLYTSNATGQCTSANGCIWRSDPWGSWCEELSCWSLPSQSECTTTNVPGKNCTWQGGGENYGCERVSCWAFAGTNEASCVNNSAGLNCEWSDYCSDTGGNPNANCWQYNNQSSCSNASGCSWGQCMDKGCWSYNTDDTCNAAKDFNGKNCTWELFSESQSWCECTLPNCPVYCNDYSSSSTDCNEHSNSTDGCLWRDGNCNQNGCWKYSNQTACNAATGISCEWKWNSCQEVDCFTWDFTNQTACENNTAGLSCIWNNGYCNKQDCWSFTTNATCSAKEECVWRLFQSSGWCNEVQCWSWDSMNGGSQSACEGNATLYDLSCLWNGNPPGDADNGWCYMDFSNVGCSNKTTERECMDTYYCWWQYNDWNNVSAGGNCNDPGVGGGGEDNTIFNEWNPGCYIFDMNSSDCNSVLGCNHSDGLCIELENSYGGNISENGINCSFINNSQLCNSIPMLSSCCSWQNGSCTQNRMTTSCWDQMTPPPQGASFCEDYNAYTSQSLCEQIAGSPWYMPCRWNNSTGTCGFKADDVFGDNSQSLTKIDNKKNCEAAGGKWIVENYCEGNISVPAGRCEYKFDEETNCDKACFACEEKDSDGNNVNATNAVDACEGSRLGYCEFTANTNAPNSIGYCNAKEQFKKGIAGDCDANCGDCTYKGDPTNNDTTRRPSYYCMQSKANSAGGGCKWVTDNSTNQGGYCIKKGEKTCEDACDRCNSQTDCANLGRTNIATTGSCRWDGDSNSGNCVPNIGADAEICWDAVDNNDNALIDCADPGCFADSFCGFVTGNCFGWTNNDTCIENDCEWVTDNWGSWCDFKGSQCWKYASNEANCSSETNCQWSNGTGTGGCEQDWALQEVCMGLSQANCLAANASGCNWTVDTWCQGTGNGTEWCENNGGWCDYEPFKPKNCWSYQVAGECDVASGCSWYTDQYSQPHCEANMSGNCWSYYDNSSCSSAGCFWKSDQWGAWCTNVMDQCWGSTQSSCNTNPRCYWQQDSYGGFCQPMCSNGSYVNDENNCIGVDGCIWKDDNGWCQDIGMGACFNATNSNNQTNCDVTDGCRWKNPGWCDPINGGFSSGAGAGGGGGMGGDCYKYDGNETLCTNRDIINISCGWFAEPNPRCEVDWSGDCWQYMSVESGCNETNGCWWKTDDFNPESGWCMNVMDQCWSNQSLQDDPDACNLNSHCNSTDFGGCEPTCFSSETSEECGSGCRWITGWCNPAGMNDMFNGMESGAPAPLGSDDCGEEGMQASVDICGFGMKDMGDSYGFGAFVNDFTNSSVCNKEAISYGGQGDGPSGGGMVGSGEDKIVFFVYLDTDGSTSGGCALSHNSSETGYEFRFKYSSVWNSTLDNAVESFNAYKCDDSIWKATDIKISVWKKLMCSEIGGPMIAVDKADLDRFPTLYDSTKDLRVYVATAGNSGNVTSPTDTAGPGWTTPGAIDFDIEDAFSYGTNSAKFEDILRNGFVKGEDCFNGFDDDGDGTVDCDDWDCQYSSACANEGINAAGYSDTRAPQVTGVKIEEYPDSALIMYDTNKPTNGTLELYGDDRCTNKTDNIYDIGILSQNVRDYKIWHSAMVYDDNSTQNISLNSPLAADSTYYYKLKVCDSAGKCAISKCSSFKTAQSLEKCGYCNFVTRIKAPTGWTVSYDMNLDGDYSDHIQGQVCGPSAGMKTNYTTGRRVNIKLSKDDGTTYFEFLNVTLTKTGLNDKVRTISGLGDIISSSSLIGLTSETRDKIINNLHPEICRVKIPNSGTCTTLYHCDDSGANCVDMTSAAGGAPVDSTNCVWNVPNCEFSTYKVATGGGDGDDEDGGGGGGGSGGGGGGAVLPEDEEDNDGGESGGDTPQQSPPVEGQDNTNGGADAGPASSSGGSAVLIWIVGVAVLVIAGVTIVTYVAIKRKKSKA